MTAGHRTYAWHKARTLRMSLARANQEACCRCGQPIDYTLHGNQRYGPTIDHLVPLQAGGEIAPTPDLLAPAHRACNSSHGQKVKTALDRMGRNANGNASRNSTNAISKSLGNVPSSSQGNSRTLPTPKVAVSESRNPTSLIVRPEYFEPHDYAPPRIITDTSNASGSLADEWFTWLESRKGPGIRLRKWQKQVLTGALSVDANGDLLYDTVVLSTARQLGKSVGLRALAMARCHFAARFGETQQVIHSANHLLAVERIQQAVWRWAESSGLTVRRVRGASRVIWDDESSWDLLSVGSVWGASASVAMLDEAWDVPEAVVSSGIGPTLVARAQSQLWLTSTANENATPLMPGYRARAIAGEERIFIAEWSVGPDDDKADPMVWRARMPWWDAARARTMLAARNTKGFDFQWLNRWPGDGAQDLRWLPEWDTCARSAGGTSGCVGSLEVSGDRSTYGAAVSVKRDDGTVDVWTWTGQDLQSGIAWLGTHGPIAVLVGLTLRTEAAGPFEVIGVGQREMLVAAPTLAAAVRRGLVRHDHDDRTGSQFGDARTTATEYGDVLSSKKSLGPIPTVKAVAWAAASALTGSVAVEESQIF